MGRPRKRRAAAAAADADALLGFSGADAPLDLRRPGACWAPDFLGLLPGGLGDDGVDGALDDALGLGPAGESPDAGLGGLDGPVPPWALAAPPPAADPGARLAAPDGPPPCSSRGVSAAVGSPDGGRVGAPVKAMPSISCGCLSSLHLALESLARLPPDVASAMRVARGVCRVARDAVDCRRCYDAPADDPLEPPPIQAFQTLMVLDALVPTACNAYASILAMVDDEAASARREARTLFFSLKDVGGLGGDARPSPVHGLDGTQLAPDAWREAVRAVLRLHVYGLADAPADAPSDTAGDTGRRGLRGVLTRLDQTARRRHDVDELVASGQVPRHSPYLLSPLRQPPCPPEQRSCVRIIEMARMALDKLVIT